MATVVNGKPVSYVMQKTVTNNAIINIDAGDSTSVYSGLIQSINCGASV